MIARLTVGVFRTAASKRRNPDLRWNAFTLGVGLAAADRFSDLTRQAAGEATWKE